jgi:hypothetical protein
LEFKNKTENFNKKMVEYQNEVLQNYDSFSLGFLKEFSNVETFEKLAPVENPRTTLSFDFKKSNFSDYYVEFVYYNLKKREKNKPSDDFYPFHQFMEMKDIYTKDFRFIKDFSMLLVKENEGFLTGGKLKRLRNKLASLPLESPNLFMRFQLLVQLHSKEIKCFNKSVTRLFEDWVLHYVSKISDAELAFDFENLLGLLFICFEIQTSAEMFEIEFLSKDFIEALRNIQYFQSLSFWERAINYAMYFVNTEDLCFFKSLDSPKRNFKFTIKSKSDILRLFISIGLGLLGLPLADVLDIFTRINHSHSIISQISFSEILRKFEPFIIEKSRDQVRAKENKILTLKDKPKVIHFVLKHAVNYFSDKHDLCNLLLLDKSTYEEVRMQVYSHVLSMLPYNNVDRLLVWKLISSTECVRKLISDQDLSGIQIDKKNDSLIKCDVRRTQLINENKDLLEQILVEVSRLFPETNYYQGMNTIGNFLLNYSNDYATAKQIFIYLMNNDLQTYFSNNFGRLKELLYVAERLLDIHVPKISAHLLKLQVMNEYYISPIILTIYTVSFQFVENYPFVIQAMDLFMVEGWTGFFKVFVIVMRMVESKVLEMNFELAMEFLNKGIWQNLNELKIENLNSEAQKILISPNDIMNISCDYRNSRKIIDNSWETFAERKLR